MRLLDDHLLAAFEALLRSKGVPVDKLRPGLTDAQIDERIQPLGLELPNEARAWWHWQDGPHGRVYVDIPPIREPMSLDEAIELHLIYRDANEEGVGAPTTPPSSLRPVGEKPLLFVQCIGSGDIPAPVFAMQDHGCGYDQVFPSFGELIQTWMDDIEQGRLVTDPRSGGLANDQPFQAQFDARGF